MNGHSSKVPSCTYRLQFNADFTFRDAADLVPYLRELGVTHCYASPYLRARSGSPHGYDIVDHNALNPEIGDETDYERFCEALKAHGMGQILDLVSNHMGVGGNDNAWWLDVLEDGPASRYARFFDIDWRPLKEALRGRVLVPLLGEHYGTVLENGDLDFRFDAERGEFSVFYYEHRFPVDPRTYPSILESDLDRLRADLGSDAAELLEFESLITAFHHLPARAEIAEERLEERHRDKEVHKKHLANLYRESAAIAGHVQRVVERFNGRRGDPGSFDALHCLLEEQAYRLSYWRVASDDINYRRFFDINDLAGLRMEDPHVFETTHRFVLGLIASNRLDGLRIDHPDGLYDPLAYFRRLRAELDAAAHASGSGGQSGYLVIEKILASYERLPSEWPVDGTTGYEFGNLVNGLYVQPENEQELTRTYSRFIGHQIDFDELLYERKKLTIRVQLSSELTVLANILDSLAEADRHTRDFTLNGLRDALIEIVASFPVYRTYIKTGEVSEEDIRYIDWAVAHAKKRSPAGDVTIYDFVRATLIEDVRHEDRDRRDAATRFAMKFQQYTAPVMAKALEDTTFYLYNRLVSLNEVGGDPRRFGVSVAAFHHNNAERLERWPRSMLASSTHDAKRSEDVRARINVLSEIPEQWQHHLSRWSRLNRSRKSLVDDMAAPSRNNEYLIYQTLVGTWPLGEPDEEEMAGYRARIKAYLLKAVKEAKVHTSWVNPNAAYEEAVERFVDALLAGGPDQNAFLADFIPFQKRIARFGLLNSLSQTLLKLTSPGVPDLYQGTEVWDFSLVDPDNRRPVDYRHRHSMLAGIKELIAKEDRESLLERWLSGLEDGTAKLFLIWQTLLLRRARDEVFAQGDYVPLNAANGKAEHICAFARRTGDSAVIVVAPRLYVGLTGDGESALPLPPSVWEDASIDISALAPVRCYRNIYTDRVHTADEIGRLTVSDVLGPWPVALLASE